MLETPPSWALALVFWLHMLATVTWLGGLAAIAILVLPAAKLTLKAPRTIGLYQRHTAPSGAAGLVQPVLVDCNRFVPDECQPALQRFPFYQRTMVAGHLDQAYAGDRDGRRQRDADLGSAASHPSRFDAHRKGAGQRRRSETPAKAGNPVAADQHRSVYSDPGGDRICQSILNKKTHRNGASFVLPT